MLALIVNGQSLDLTADVSITLKYSSPIFNTIGDFTYPFKIPVTPKNAIILGFKHRVENSNDPYQEFDASLEMDGIFLLQGSLRILKADPTLYEATLFMDKGDFYYRRKNLTLQDIDFGELVFTGETLKMDYINDCKNKAYPQRPVAFPMILNKTYFEELPPEPVLEYFNYYVSSLIYYFTPSAEPYDRSVIVPMLYLRYVLEKIFEFIDFKFDDSFFSRDRDYNSLAIFNLVDCNTTATGFFFYDKLKLLLNYHVPRMNLNDFFIELERFFNLRFFVNNTSRTVRLKSVDHIVKSAEYIEFSNKIISTTVEPETKITGYSLKMDMDSGDEFEAAGKAAQDVVLGHILSPVQSISDLTPWPSSQVYDTRFVIDENDYYVLNPDQTWAVSPAIYWTWNMYSQWIYKNKDQSIETKFSTMIDDGITPYNCVVGNSREAWKEVSPKLFFVHYQDNGYGDETVHARCFTPTNNLFYGGQFGLLNKHYKAYLDFRMSSKSVKIIKQMTLMDLKTLDFSLKYMVNGVKYLLSDVQVSISNSGIKPATIKAYPIP